MSRPTSPIYHICSLVGPRHRYRFSNPNWPKRIPNRWRSKLGRRHPFMFAAPIPVMACLFLIYSPPEGWSDFNLFLWLTTLTVVMRSSMTLFHVPHLALGAELSADFTERSRVMSLNTLLGALGGFGTAYVAYSFVFAATPEYLGSRSGKRSSPSGKGGGGIS